MELHWDKFQLLQVQCQANVRTPTGEHISAKLGIDYDGLPGHELGRKIGMAKRACVYLPGIVGVLMAFKTVAYGICWHPTRFHLDNAQDGSSAQSLLPRCDRHALETTTPPFR